MTHLCVIMCERGSHQSFVKLGAPHLGQHYVLKMSAVLSTKAGAVVFTYSIKEGTSEFRTSAVLQVGECDYAPGTTSSEPDAPVSLRVAQCVRW